MNIAYIHDTVVIVKKENAHLFRTHLRQNDLIDKSRIVKKLSDDCVAIPVNTRFIDNFSAQKNFYGIPFSIEKVYLQKSKYLQISPKDRMLNCVKVFCKEKAIWTSSLEKDLPSTWEKHADMLILPPNCFCQDIWTTVGSDLWKKVAAATSCCRVARQKSVRSNDFRSPNVELLLGSDGWVEHIDNKIRYTFDVTRCMFSSGNVTEKLRVASFNCQNETVVDLYAGIGYFTLPYLVHSGASLVFACEWNPDAVEALKRNLHLNGVNDRCVVLFGDNRQTCPKGVADRVNLGLIPSSEPGWFSACAALKCDTGGILHVHGNVTSSYRHSHISTTEECRRKASSGDQQSSIENVDAGLQLVKLLDHEQALHCCSKRSSDVEHSDQMNDAVVSTSMNAECSSKSKFAKTRRPRVEWCSWADSVCRTMEKHLLELHDQRWSAHVLHVEHVKSYAPHVDHVVADIRCSPD